MRCKATIKNEVWGLDFIHDTTVGGRNLKMLVVHDEYTGECLAIKVERTFRDANVMADLDELTAIRGALVYIRRENGPELVRKSSDAGARTQTQARTSSSPERRGRSASWRASTAGCATSCCRRRPLRRRPRPSTSSNGGDATTTTVDRPACAGQGAPPPPPRAMRQTVLQRNRFGSLTSPALSHRNTTSSRQP